jgi:cytochrome P450
LISLAYTEMRLVLARLIWNFELELAEDSIDWLPQQIFAVWKKGPLNVKLTPVVRERHD